MMSNFLNNKVEIADENIMKLVIVETRHGIEHGQTPFGACVVKDGEVISLHNAVWGGNDATTHAELEAIRAACKQLHTRDLSGCTVYSTCAPCAMCFGACHWAGISKIVYGVSLQDAMHVGLGDLPISPETMKQLGNSPIEVVGGFLLEENLELFRLWADQHHDPHQRVKPSQVGHEVADG